MNDEVKLSKRERKALEKELHLLRYRQYAGTLLPEDRARLVEITEQLQLIANK